MERREKSEDAASYVFVVGAQRSGTSWVQQLLGAHPMAATPPETAIFQRYLGPLYASWEDHLDDMNAVIAALRESRRPPCRLYGLPNAITEEDLDHLASQLIRRLRRRVLDAKPGAHILIEKTPIHALYIDLILKLVPDVTIVHIVRDPRDVTASLVKAGRGWGEYWAPSSAAAAAAQWSRYVAAVLEAAEETDSILQIRYEKLRGDPAKTLKTLFNALGLEATMDEAVDITERLSLYRQRQEGTTSFTIAGEAGRALKDIDYREPEGFYGDRDRRSWEDLFGWRERWMIWEYAGPLMVHLGYAADASWTGIPGPLRPAARAVYAAASSARRSGGRLLRYLIRQLS